MSLIAKIDQARQLLIHASVFSQSRAVILFSGGKDSIVTAHLAKTTIGVSNAFSEISLLPRQTQTEVQAIGKSLGLSVYSNNELPPKAFVKHWHNHIPPVKWKPSDLDKIRHWKSMPRYAKKNGVRLMIYGRRTEENTIPEPFYLKKSTGIFQVHPIWNWTRSEVFEYLDMHQIEYPSCYKTGAKHLYSVVSMGMHKYQETGSMRAVYDVWHEHAWEYLAEAGKHYAEVKAYLQTK